ncbi:MAG: noncanonical pyrimidine nucleotidase, YjjG family [Ruminococcaceae bacterium]|nr:noncanonical pyrimidine nucleotidase, YjjG family [Oscillospiraceae bacterium]
MRKYTTLLFDADMTLFDFEGAEKRAFGIVMAEAGIQYSDGDFERYRAINSDLWARFGRGEITKDYLQSERFTAFLRTVDARFTGEDGRRINAAYLEALADCSELLPGAEMLCRRLAADYTLYIVTNGVSRTQKKRFAASPIRPYFGDIFVSEDAGVPKPDPRYFDYVFAHIGEERRADSVIIGDSLTSDIAGGKAAGIDTIWYNPDGKDCGEIHPTAEAADFDALYRIITQA